jgi:hypothetical protein
MTAPRIATFKSLTLRADCLRPELASSNTCYLTAALGNPQYTWELFAKGLFLLWQTAVLERGLLQQSEIQYQPFCHIFVINIWRATFKVWNSYVADFFNSEQYRYTNVLSWHTISRYYRCVLIAKDYKVKMFHTRMGKGRGWFLAWFGDL